MTRRADNTTEDYTRKFIYNMNSRTNRIEKLKTLKEKPCTDCKKTYPWYVMQFDHVRGVKTKGFTNKGIKSLYKELDVCDLVCANCHFKRSHARVEYLRGVFND